MPVNHLRPTRIQWTPEELSTAIIGNASLPGVRYVKSLMLDGPSPREYSTHPDPTWRLGCYWCGTGHSFSALHEFSYEDRYAPVAGFQRSAVYCSDCIYPCLIEDPRQVAEDGRRFILIGHGSGVEITRYEMRFGYLTPRSRKAGYISFAAYERELQSPTVSSRFRTCNPCGRITDQPVWFTECPEQDGYECPDCKQDRLQRERRIIKGYHEGTRNPRPIAAPWSERRNGLFFGVELEVEMRDGYSCEGCDDDGDCDGDCSESQNERIEVAQNILSVLFANPGPLKNPLDAKREVIRFEEDGSLDNGFEIITLPLSLPDQRHVWNTILSSQQVRRDIISHQTETCGLHIHISRRALTDDQIRRIRMFVNNAENKALIQAVARRYNVGYARIQSNCTMSDNVYEGDRYAVVNVTPANTIEFRLFRGSCNPEAVIAALEFVNALVYYCRTDMQHWNPSLDAAPFLNFLSSAGIRRETKTLREYLKTRGIVWTKNTWSRMRNTQDPTLEG